MSDSTVVSFGTDEERASEIEEYQANRNHDSKSEAVNELVEIGLREASNPFVYRWYQRGMDIIGLVLLVAVFAALAGVAGAWEWIDVFRYVAVSVLFAFAMLAWLLVVKVYYGQSELGAWLRGGESE